jgi:NAD(P)-dependent dehydrogenase (short-subunit alcohol dehydrogenase family)
LAVELGPYDILVNAVAPGFMLTPMSIVKRNETETPTSRVVNGRGIPLRRTGYPEDVSGTVIFSRRNTAAMTGQLLIVDGGLMSTF